MIAERIEMDVGLLALEIGTMLPQELDALPFGAIQVDATGAILSYNQAQERMSGRKAEAVIGKNFFFDVAPCTRVQRFHGAFQSGVQRRKLNEVFDFLFRFPAGPREVRIRMIYSGVPKPAVWIFVTPIGS